MDQRLNDELPEELSRALAALDEEATRAAAGVDAARVAERVLAGLHAPAVTVVPPWRRRGLRVAAAVALVALGAALLRPRSPASDAVATLPVSVELPDDSLGEAAVESLFVGVEREPVVAAQPSSPTLEDLSEAELRALLQALESSEGES